MSETKGRVFQMRVDDDFLRQLDDLRRIEDDLPSRAELLRRLVEAAHAKFTKKGTKK